MPEGNREEDGGRALGLLGATGVGVGAIVGGGILALSGVAFATTGPSAVLAFAVNGVIALLTAASFAELSANFPQSGGTYTFARKVLSVEAAFAVGWVVWFASIVAAVLYAIGFGYFAGAIARVLLGDGIPAWAGGGRLETGLAIVAVFGYAADLCLRKTSGGLFANISKVVVFFALIAGGLWMMLRTPAADLTSRLTPFFSAGFPGLIQAMGFTFIALQGFDLIAAVGGQIRDPGRNIPKAMFISLGIALGIYLPMLVIVSTVGMGPGQNIAEASAAEPETIVALAARNFLGPAGYWLVMAAAIFSMLSALRANLQASSRVAEAMAQGRTLPEVLGRTFGKRRKPVPAILLTAGIVILLLVVLADVAAAGAAASLIFLLSFTLAHVIALLARKRRSAGVLPFRAPFFPLVPVLGGTACLSLGVFQGLAVPRAGMITLAWLAAGIVLFLSLFARRARVVDAGSEALDPEVVRLRGRSPLVLVPVSNPDNARGLVTLAAALAPRPGRVLLLNVVVPPEEGEPRDRPAALRNAQAVLGEALSASLETGVIPEALTTIAPDPFREIGHVARSHGCESVLLGMSRLAGGAKESPIDALADSLDTNIVVLRADSDWRMSSIRKILIPLGGMGGYAGLRARLLGSLFRTGKPEIRYLRVLPESATEGEVHRAGKFLQRIGSDEVPGHCETLVERGDRPADNIVRNAEWCDLLVLGLQRRARRSRALGAFTLAVAGRTSCPLLLISHPR